MPISDGFRYGRQRPGSVDRRGLAGFGLPSLTSLLRYSVERRPQVFVVATDSRDCEDVPLRPAASRVDDRRAAAHYSSLRFTMLITLPSGARTKNLLTSHASSVSG